MPVAAGEATAQERDDAVDVALFDLSASDCRN
jgi:hypothetical protein